MVRRRFRVQFTVSAFISIIPDVIPSCFGRLCLCRCFGLFPVIRLCCRVPGMFPSVLRVLSYVVVAYAPRYLCRERRLVVLIVWGLTLCRRRSRFVVVPCSNAYIVWGLTLCRRRSRRRLIPHLTGYEPWALPGLKLNDLPPSVAHRRLATRHRTPCYTHYTIVPR